MRTSFFLTISLIALNYSYVFSQEKTNSKVEVGTVDIVAELPFNPGNVAVSKSGRIFSSVHQFRSPDMKVIEVVDKYTFRPYPDAVLNGIGDPDSVFNAVLGIYVDPRDRLWVLDNGNTSEPTPPKLMVFDINTDELVYRYDFAEAVAPPGTFLQDLVVDPNRDLAFIADIGGNLDPAIVFVDLKNQQARRFTGHASLQPESVNMVVEGDTIVDNQGEPVRNGVNPITISSDYDTIFFGAMNGTTWYALPTQNFIREVDDNTLEKTITAVGKKTVSDGAASDAEGNHYFTDVNNNAITYYSTSQDSLIVLAEDDRFIWPDNVRFGDSSWLYVSVNQLSRTPTFNQGKETAELPFRIYRIWTGAKGHF